MGMICSTLFRKPLAGNSLLHAGSSHPEKLIRSIPYSQFLRLRRNCTHDVDFQKEADSLCDHLLTRGYSNTCLRKAFNRVKNLNRHHLLYKPRQDKSSTSTRIITKYNRQHAKLRSIYNKYWYLLAADQKVCKFIGSHPEITYRRSRSLVDTLVTSHHISINSIKNKSPGTYPCGRCNFCRFIISGRSVELPNGSTWTPKHRTNCQSVGSVYLMICSCGAFYVGKTKRPLFCRIRDHVSLISKHKMETSISRHVGLHHSYNLKCIGFFSLEHLPPHERGGGIDNKLLQLETRWIYTLQATRSPHLNKGISYKPFLWVIFLPPIGVKIAVCWWLVPLSTPSLTDHGFSGLLSLVLSMSSLRVGGPLGVCLSIGPAVICVLVSLVAQ